jgi:serine/threonine protein kinase
MAESSPAPLLQEQIGPYRLEALLGEGGMGRVYEAIDVRLQRRVALKVMKESLLGTPQMRQRFIREAQANAAIRHDNVVTIYDVGEQDGRLFLASELLRGATLDQVLDAGRVFAPRQAAQLAIGLASGLEAAHAAGVVHRDIKPANIWLEAESDRPKLLDFGLALRTGPADPLGRPGAVAGTPHYLSPEQSQDLPIDARSDLYQLGVVLFRLLSGRLPFIEDDLPRLLMAIIGDPAPSLDSVAAGAPASLCELVDRQLSKHPWERIGSATAVRERLQELLPQLPDDPRQAYRQPIVVRTDRTGPSADRMDSAETDAPIGKLPPESMAERPVSPWRQAAIVAIASVSIAVSGAAMMWLWNRWQDNSAVTVEEASDSGGDRSTSAPEASLKHLEIQEQRADQAQVAVGEPILIDFLLANRAPTDQVDPARLFQTARSACQVTAMLRQLDSGVLKPAQAFPIRFSGNELPRRAQSATRQFRIDSVDLPVGRYEVILQLQTADRQTVMEATAPVELMAVPP